MNNILVGAKRMIPGDYQIIIKKRCLVKYSVSKKYRVVLNEVSKEWHLYCKDEDGKFLGGGWEWSEGGFDTKKEVVEFIKENKI